MGTVEPTVGGGGSFVGAGVSTSVGSAVNVGACVSVGTAVGSTLILCLLAYGVMCSILPLRKSSNMIILGPRQTTNRSDVILCFEIELVSFMIHPEKFFPPYTQTMLKAESRTTPAVSTGNFLHENARRPICHSPPGAPQQGRLSRLPPLGWPPFGNRNG